MLDVVNNGLCKIKKQYLDYLDKCQMNTSYPIQITKNGFLKHFIFNFDFQNLYHRNLINAIIYIWGCLLFI